MRDKPLSKAPRPGGEPLDDVVTLGGGLNLAFVAAHRL